MPGQLLQKHPLFPLCQLQTALLLNGSREVNQAAGLLDDINLHPRVLVSGVSRVSWGFLVSQETALLFYDTQIGNGIFPAVSVNGGCQSSAIAATADGELLRPEGSGGKDYLPYSGHHTAAAPDSELWANSGYWPLRAEGRIKGTISVEADSCIFPYIEKC